MGAYFTKSKTWRQLIKPWKTIFQIPKLVFLFQYRRLTLKAKIILGINFFRAIVKMRLRLLVAEGCTGVLQMSLTLKNQYGKKQEFR